MNTTRVGILVKHIESELSTIFGQSNSQAERCKKVGGWSNPAQFIWDMEDIHRRCEPSYRAFNNIVSRGQEKWKAEQYQYRGGNTPASVRDYFSILGVEDMQAEDIASLAYSARSTLQGIASVLVKRLDEDVIYSCLYECCTKAINLINELIEVLFD